MKSLKFATDVFTRPHGTHFLDAYTTLHHYCQINYSVPTSKLQTILPKRFEPTIINHNNNHHHHEEPQSIISAVVFQEKNFHFQNLPFLGNYTFAQTNYRTYCLDKQTNQRTVWFFGTSLDHWSLFIPKYIWKFPWYRADILFDCKYNDSLQAYERYMMRTDSVWAPAKIVVKDTGRQVTDEDFPGFPDKETGLIYLTQPMSGHFHLTTKKTRLGCWEIYHQRMNPTIGQLEKQNENQKSSNSIGLFERMGLITKDQKPYNILLQNTIDYDIFLPPIESIAKGSRYESQRNKVKQRK